jgi:hypothetical protein
MNGPARGSTRVLCTEFFTEQEAVPRMELLIYALALGVAAVYIVPILAGIAKGFLPATVSAQMTVPTTYPQTFSAGLWSIVFWGALLGVALWAISFVRPVKRAIQREA